LFLYFDGFFIASAGNDGGRTFNVAFVVRRIGPSSDWPERLARSAINLLSHRQAIDQAIDIDDDSSCPQTTAMASQKWAAQF